MIKILKEYVFEFKMLLKNYYLLLLLIIFKNLPFYPLKLIFNIWEFKVDFFLLKKQII